MGQRESYRSASVLRRREACERNVVLRIWQIGGGGQFTSCSCLFSFVPLFYSKTFLPYYLAILSGWQAGAHKSYPLLGVAFVLSVLH